MAVGNLVGCDISEAYGDSFDKKKKKSGKKTGGKCDSMKKNPVHVDDIMNDYYHPSIYGIYEKSRYSRNQHPLQDTDSEDRDADDDKYVEIGEGVKEPTKNSQEHYSDSAATKLSPKTLLMIHEEREKRYLDLSMYVFSGVALIFILEQFINLGVALKA
jgi:hypothetical protein